MKRCKLFLTLAALSLVATSSQASQAHKLTFDPLKSPLTFSKVSSTVNYLQVKTKPVFADRQPQVVAEGVDVTFDNQSNLGSFVAKLGDGVKAEGESDKPADTTNEEKDDADKQPSEQPTNSPTTEPTNPPSEQPADAPTTQPETTPSEQPVTTPSEKPAETPASNPESAPESTPETAPESTPSTSNTADGEQPSTQEQGEQTEQAEQEQLTLTTEDSSDFVNPNALTGGVYLAEGFVFPTGVNSYEVETSKAIKTNHELDNYQPKPITPEFRELENQAPVTVEGVFSTVDLISSVAQTALKPGALDSYNNLVADFKNPKETVARSNALVEKLEQDKLVANLDVALNGQVVADDKEHYALRTDNTDVTKFRSYSVPVSPLNPAGFWPNPLPSLNDLLFATGAYPVPAGENQVNPLGALIRDYQPQLVDGKFYPDYASFSFVYDDSKVKPIFYKLTVDFAPVQLAPVQLATTEAVQQLVEQLKAQEEEQASQVETEATEEQEATTNEENNNSSDKPAESDNNSDKPADNNSDKPANSDSDKPADNNSDKPADNNSDKPANSDSDKPADNNSDKPAEDNDSNNNSSDNPEADKPADADKPATDENNDESTNKEGE
ncbi:hypothetical protein CKF54_05570 [Psittacicella hinzii]|uniref:Uncharacterized protein n=1 Tax=Psittacicella hinzii TaxID=2028575 RepID=A0A3A1Y4A7_9GAMM|nr:hypothetical protein [Psittacicella hinzii]RIY32058.1 hypothetical protein CKF54_05570 [Psittacicella hinzii]